MNTLLQPTSALPSEVQRCTFWLLVSLKKQKPLKEGQGEAEIVSIIARKYSELSWEGLKGLYRELIHYIYVQ